MRGFAGVPVDLGEEVLGVPESVSPSASGLEHVVGALPSGISPRAHTSGTGTGRWMRLDVTSKPFFATSAWLWYA